MDIDLFAQIRDAEKSEDLFRRIREEWGVEIPEETENNPYHDTEYFVGIVFDVLGEAGKAPPPLPGEGAAELYPGVWAQVRAGLERSLAERGLRPESINEETELNGFTPRWRRYRVFKDLEAYSQMDSDVFFTRSKESCGLSCVYFLLVWAGAAFGLRQGIDLIWDKALTAGFFIALLSLGGVAKLVEFFVVKSGIRTAGELARRTTEKRAKDLQARALSRRLNALMLECLDVTAVDS